MKYKAYKGRRNIFEIFHSFIFPRSKSRAGRFKMGNTYIFWIFLFCSAQDFLILKIKEQELLKGFLWLFFFLLFLYTYHVLFRHFSSILFIFLHIPWNIILILSFIAYWVKYSCIHLITSPSLAIKSNLLAYKQPDLKISGKSSILRLQIPLFTTPLQLYLSSALVPIWSSDHKDFRMQMPLEVSLLRSRMKLRSGKKLKLVWESLLLLFKIFVVTNFEWHCLFSTQLCSLLPKLHRKILLGKIHLEPNFLNFPLVFWLVSFWQCSD